MFFIDFRCSFGLEAGFRTYTERQSVRDLPQRASPLLPEDVYEDLVPVLRREVMDQWKRREDRWISGQFREILAGFPWISMDFPMFFHHFEAISSHFRPFRSPGLGREAARPAAKGLPGAGGMDQRLHRAADAKGISGQSLSGHENGHETDATCLKCQKQL